MFKYTFYMKEEIVDCDNCPLFYEGFACSAQVNDAGLMIVTDNDLIDTCPLGIDDKDKPIANFCL